MMVIRDAEDISPQSAEAIVITGDGLNETERIKAIAPKFNADRKLLFPHGTSATASAIDVIVGKQQPTDPDSRTGFSALGSIEDYHNRKALRSKLRPDPTHRYLFVSDKEDKNSGFGNGIQRELEQIADTRQSVGIQSLEDHAYKCQCIIGSLPTTVYCAFVGNDTGCFEDGLAEILDLRENRSINASSRRDLKGLLTEILGNPSGKELLEDAEKWEIQTAFPDLSACLREFEED